MFKRIVIAISIFSLFATGAFAAYQVSHFSQDQAATNTKTVTNESLVQEYDAYQFVDVALDEFTAGFNDSVTVYNSSNATLEEGTDYKWNSTDGTIIFLNTSDTTEGNNAYITYEYEKNTPDVQALAGPLNVSTEALGKLPILAAGMGFVVFFLLIGLYMKDKFTSSGPVTNR